MRYIKLKTWQILLINLITIILVLISSPLWLNLDRTEAPTIPDSHLSITNKEYAYVKEVIDGDTFITNKGKRVRLIGIDAPEMNYNKESPPECKAEQSKEALSKMILNKQVVLIKDKSDTDKYGRLLRYVYVGDTFVNAELVKLGLAKVKYYPPDTSKHAYLKRLENIAKQSKLGIYSCETE